MFSDLAVKDLNEFEESVLMSPTPTEGIHAALERPTNGGEREREPAAPMLLEVEAEVE